MAGRLFQDESLPGRYFTEQPVAASPSPEFVAKWQSQKNFPLRQNLGDAVATIGS
jgi:hypothetical protein